MDNTVYSKMFTWLFVGLLITFGSGYLLSTNLNLLLQLAQIGLLPIIIAELIIAFAMGLLIKKLPEWLMKVLYIFYSVLTGITFGFIFTLYQMSSIISIFAICALIFALLAFYGMVTKADLSRFGLILFFMLLGLVIGEFINLFVFKNNQADILMSAIGVGVFTLYIAYDTNRVKLMLPLFGEEKAAIYGAFQLYLDFINLFIELLNLFGKRND
jgi:uncharacterized protein